PPPSSPGRPTSAGRWCGVSPGDPGGVQPAVQRRRARRGVCRVTHLFLFDLYKIVTLWHEFSAGCRVSGLQRAAGVISHRVRAMKTTDTIPLAGLRYDLLRHYLALVAVLAFGLVLAADVHAQTRGGRGSTSGGASRTEEDRSDDRRERARPAPQATPQQPTRQAEPRTREQSTSRGSTGGSRPSR